MHTRRAALSFLLLAVVTYMDVKPILERNCVECHTYGSDLDVSGLPFVGTGEPTRILDRMIARATSSSMPPGNRPKLTAQELGVLKAWRDGGMKP